MKASLLRIERRIVGTVANQVITFLIVQHPFEAFVQIVIVEHGKGARARGEIPGTLLAFAYTARTVQDRLLDDGTSTGDKIFKALVSANKEGIYNSARVHRINHHRCAIGRLDYTLETVKYPDAGFLSVRVVQGETVGKQNHSFSPRQFAHAFHHIVDGA